MWFTKALIISVFLNYNALADSKKHILRLTKFENGCPGLKPVLRFTEVTINKSKLDFKAYISEDAIGELKVEFTIERCLNRDSPNTCEKYHTLKVPYYCRLLNIGVWAAFSNGTTPEWKCPFRKGTIVTNRSILLDINDFSIVSVTGNYYWKMDTRIYLQDTRKLLICLYVEVETFVT